MELIYLEWHDAFSQNGWLEKKEVEHLADSEETIVCQAGWLFKETKREIVLVSRYGPKSEGFKESFGLIQKIPKTWIRKRINLSNYLKGEI